MSQGPIRRWLGLAAIGSLCACSLLVDTSPIDEGCPAGQKFCAGNCVSVSDPTYGCKPTSCEPCRTDNGIPTCNADNRCGFDTCLYGFGCADCSAKILTDKSNCGSCGHACGDDETCSVGVCVDSGAGGAGGEGGAPARATTSAR